MKKAVLSAIAAALILATQVANAVPPLIQRVSDLETVGWPVGDCGNFQVLADWTIDGSLKIFFDDEGNVIRLQVHGQRGEIIYYNSLEPSKFLTGLPHAPQNETQYWADGVVSAVHGVIFKVIVPGRGVIYAEGGRLVYDWGTGEVVAQSGPFEIYDGNAADLCAALSE